MEKEQIDTLMNEIGPLVDAAGLSYSDDAPIWELQFEDRPPCYLQASEREDQYILSGEVAEPPVQGREALFQTMLIYNDQGGTTGGARLALDGDEDGWVTLAIDLHVSELSPEKFSNLVSSYLDLRSHWRRVVEGWTGEDDQGDRGDRDQQSAGPIIRV